MQDWVLFILFSIEHEDILNSKGFHISVHLWLLCPLCNFAHLSQTLLLATSGENGIQRYAILCNFLPFYRTLTLCWFTTWMSPTRMTTRCWWLTPWRSGVRRRSGPRRSSLRNSSQCVSVGIFIIPSLLNWTKFVHNNTDLEIIRVFLVISR